VLLAGEEGIGKSRLVQVLKDHIAGEAHTWLECRGSPYYQHTAWYPIIDLVQRWLQWQPGEAPGAAVERLEALLVQAPLALDEAMPMVADLVALPLPAERYPPQVLPPEQQRHETFATLLALVRALAERQPVLVIVEDLHWVDPSTLELLGLPLDQVATTRLCLGTLYSQIERLDDARAALSTAIHMYRILEMSFWLPQGEATLRQVSD
jgi:predicted ATPase